MQELPHHPPQGEFHRFRGGRAAVLVLHPSHFTRQYRLHVLAQRHDRRIKEPHLPVLLESQGGLPDQFTGLPDDVGLFTRRG
nr:hypothetical protein [Arthrobacter globiformis]